MPESSEPSKFVSHRVGISGESDLRKDPHSIKFKERPQLFLKPSFGELRDSKLSDLRPFDNSVGK